ncbi:polyphosphate kinase 1 [Mucilaginibacter agri]|uniref:Polyphosphate kinase n=1 Tax=Mucilaginibacter agri TaxID=2695265 RepID=A0A966DU98_9SPHI|nr:polyphosphate kinase 1 [Mucilaginibacter agri]NCD71500.1 polyphosphate kinase 1 [Mucilaginibacter agri]
MANYRFFNRDLSWLGFNQRVMEEAANPAVPLLERIKFLSIFSSNLDEFYRVRMPVLRALKVIGEKDKSDINADEQTDILQKAVDFINQQQSRFGDILRQQLLPAFKEQRIHIIYNEEFPEGVHKATVEYFLTEVLAFLQPVSLNDKTEFFPENNKLYFIVQLKDQQGAEQVVLLNIPSDELSRFFSTKIAGIQYIAFLDDIIKFNLDKVFPGSNIAGCYSFKVTRDAELDLKDEYSGSLSDQIEKQLSKRDFGLATRFLHQPGIPLRILQMVKQQLDLLNATNIEGGYYHNFKDFFSLPVNAPGMSYEPWPGSSAPGIRSDIPLVDQIAERDFMIHTPYQNYETILRFFNEAAVNPDVNEIFVTLYRVASNSRIVHALISAAKNGKKVNVMVELKARFDEANNLKWAKVMKDAGVTITYSVTALKVHAKIGLVKMEKQGRMVYAGLLATGNFNESTAKFYTDHILFTANHELLGEMELLFMFLAKREKPSKSTPVNFNKLLVAQFNLQTRFSELIDREIAFAKEGLPAEINLKMNNLEDQVLIGKLYEASQAGVRVSLIIRSICCLIPGVKGMSENITVKRIVDRYLEHGRVFIFGNNGNKEVYMGSADWMNRNIYHRIEVCFPVYDEAVKQAMISIVDLQLKDNVQAVMLNQQLENIPIKAEEPLVRSQEAIYQLLSLK